MKFGYKKSCHSDFHSQTNKQASDTFHIETQLSAPAQPKLGMGKVSFSKSAVAQWSRSKESLVINTAPQAWGDDSVQS